MPMELHTRFDTSQVERTLSALTNAVSHPMLVMPDAMNAAGDVYMDAMTDRFEHAAAGDGTWAPLSPYTLAEKRAAGYPDDILERTTDLASSLIRGNPGHVDEPLSDGVRRGTSVPYAASHQFGDPSRNLPARTILVEPDAASLGQIGQTIVGGLSDALK